MARIEQSMMNGWQFTLGEPKDENFLAVDLPHDWAVSAPFSRSMDQGGAQGFRDRWGIGWYRRTLTLAEKEEGALYYLDFGGIYENSTVWVNGNEAGGHHYGYSSFRFDVTQWLHSGENEILIRVDNTARPADRWYSGCGIYRTIKMIEVPCRHLDERDITVQTTVQGTDALVTVDAGIRGTVRGILKGIPESGRRKECRRWKEFAGIQEKGNSAGLPCGEGQTGCEADGAVCCEAVSEDGRFTLSVPDAKLWSAEEPNLYQLTLQLLENGTATDEVSMRIGIREVLFVPEKGMLVNGNPVKLKGVCLHQDVGCRGIAAKKEIWRQRLLELKELGCNAIRAAHHMHSSEFMDLCDEMGFYVYEECFDKWTGGLYGRYFKTDWKEDLECMVKRDRCRPSVVIWGVGNEVENQGQDSMLAILKMLRDAILEQDVTRPVTYAMNPHFKRESRVDVSKVKDIQKFVDEADDTEIYAPDERVERIRGIGQIVDIISCNYQEQWYDMIHKAIPDKLILGTEIYQYFKGHMHQMQNFTDENPSLVPFERDYVIGGMIWTGYDYLGESVGYPAKGWGGSLLRTNLERRPSFYMLQSYWKTEPVVHFSVMDYSLADEGVKEHWDMPIYADHWHFPQFHKTVIPYMIASNCEEVALFLNGKRFYTARPAECANRMITGFIPWQPGTVEAIGYLGGNEVCRHTVKTPGPAVQTVFDQESVKAEACEGYEILLTARACDEDGTPYFRESTLVRFRVEGPVKIVGVDSGNLMSSEPCTEEFIHMYRGCASVVIRLTGEPGRIAVYADAEGMKSGVAVIAVAEKE